jgi:hypothetical protein
MIGKPPTTVVFSDEVLAVSAELVNEFAPARGSSEHSGIDQLAFGHQEVGISD